MHLPWLALDVFKRPGVNLRDEPAVVTEAQQVFCMNEPVRKAGINPGVSLATVRSLVPDLIHYARDPEAETQRMQYLVTVAYEFTPYVSVAMFDALLLEMAGSLKLFGGIKQTQRQLRKRFGRLGHRIAIGIAHTPRAALACAKFGNEIAWSDYPQADEIEATGLQQLRGMPLACLELKPKTRERFENMGMRQVGDLMQVPQRELRKRFGDELMTYLEHLTGDRIDLLKAEQPQESFSERLHLIDPIRGKDEVLEPMRHLAEMLSAWLGRTNLGVRRLGWGVYTFEGDGTTFEVGFEQPRHELDEIMAITQLRMEAVELPGEAMTIALDALRISHRGAKWVERDVLGQPLAQSLPPRELLERLTARLGAEALQRFALLDDHRPEFAWKPTEEESEIAASAALSVPIRGRRPLWLLEPPVKVRGEHLQIVSGPERIQCGWWEREQRRDYFVARDRDGGWCWCFRDAQGWFVHGYFA